MNSDPNQLTIADLITGRHRGDPLPAAPSAQPTGAAPPPPPPGYVLQAPEQSAMKMAVGNPDGLIAPGNIDLTKRPIVKNPDGSYSTVRSISVDQDGRSYLIPTVVGDRVVSNDEAIKHFQQTGENLGQFKTWQQADAYAKQLHDQQAAEYDAKAGQPNSPPPPPPGYVIDPTQHLPDVTVTPEAEPSLLDQLKRSSAGALRSVAHGVASIPGIINDPIVNSLNWAEGKVGIDPKYRFGTASQAADYLMSKARVPEYTAQTPTERVVNNIEEGMGSALGTMGTGALLKGASNGVTSSIGDMLTQNAGGQVASAATGAGAAGIAREKGVGTAGQIAAGLIGGVTPATIEAAGAGAVRTAIRGGEAGRQTVENNLKAFETAGTTPTVGQATQSRTLQSAESLLAKAPGSSGVMQQAAENQADQASQGIDALADQLSKVRDPAGAGRTIERGISGAGGFMDRFRQESGALYDKLDNYIPADKRIDVSNTMQVLPELNPTIPGAPATSKLFQNARIRGIEEGLKTDTGGPDAALTRPEVQAKADDLAQALGNNNAAIESSNAAGKQAVDEANLLRDGTQKQTFTPSQPLSQDEIQANIKQLASTMVDGKLPYEALKKLRTLVGNEMSNNSLVSDVPRSKWTALYGALSKDLQGAAQDAGPQAQQAWSRANAYYRAGSNRIDTIANVVDKSGGPEAIFNAATSGTRDGATTLRSVMQSLQPDEQKVLASVMVRRLGRATPGAQNATGDAFSMSSYLTNWNRLSPDAKKALFGRFGPKFSQDMDHLATMADNVRSGSKVFANPSGTATTAANIAAWTSMIGSLASGQVHTAATIGAGVGGANLIARVMTNPRFVGWLARQTRLGIPPQLANVANLRNMAQEHDDPDLKAMADLVKDAQQEGAQGAVQTEGQQGN